jgi:Skp family chaperone for outer membrane proteins
MKNRLLWTLVIAVALCASALAQGPQSAAPAATGPLPKMKVAIVDVLAFREQIGELKIKYEKLTAEFQPKYRELEALQSSIKAKEQVLGQNKNLTPQQAAKLNEEYEQAQKDFKRTTEDMQALANKRERDETEAIYDKLSKFMDQYCAKNGITHVFDANRLRETGTVVYAVSTANITEAFIKEYNKANPAAGAPAPATANKQ